MAILGASAKSVEDNVYWTQKSSNAVVLGSPAGVGGFSDRTLVMQFQYASRDDTA